MKGNIMYAIIKTGGQQFKVAKNDTIKINKIPGEKGAKVEFDQVLLVQDKETKVGTPLVEKAKVTAVIADQCKGKKLLIGKHKRRKDYQKITGFRPLFTQVVIKEIKG
jgi:large subunit ribosomal protein L21